MMDQTSVIVVADVIREHGTIDRQRLYETMTISRAVFESCIRALVSADLIHTQGELLVWTATAGPASDLLLGQGRH